MPTFMESKIGGFVKQFKWDSKTGVFSKKPEDMTDAQAMAYVNKSREESKQEDPRNQPPMTREEEAEAAFKELDQQIEESRRKRRRNMGGVMRHKPIGFKGHF